VAEIMVPASSSPERIHAGDEEERTMTCYWHRFLLILSLLQLWLSNDPHSTSATNRACDFPCLGFECELIYTMLDKKAIPLNNKTTIYLSQ
jgi:hypothetical protein